ncbi:hypothetical protein [Paracoccus tibetensis]|nr:hypothetical protein [Paracoccus tibetensis]
MTGESNSYRGPTIPSAFATRSYERAEAARPKPQLALKVTAFAAGLAVLAAMIAAF